MNEEKLFNVILNQDFHYPTRISQTKIVDIIEKATEGDMDFYIEQLVSYAWEGEWDLYLSYYDTTLEAIVLINSLEDDIMFDSDEEVRDYILWLEIVYNNFKNKVLNLNKEKDE